ncbi:endolytic transglycosylase MltG [Candidatus Fermentibacteria bacterium]|nr:endolytic transglycosylase MltG [Candidatus Fermentibacteria bacterium]
MRVMTLIAASTLLVAVISVAMVWRIMTTPAGAERWVRFDLSNGVTLSEAAAMLADSGLIRHPDVLRLWGRLSRKDRVIQAGPYLLSSAMSPQEILDHLARGQVIATSVTLPEGIMMVEIASALQASVGVDSAQFMRICTSDSFIATLGFSAASLEGYLFPDTYSFRLNARADRIASVMVARLRAMLGSIDWDEGLTRLSFHEILTLASIVEKETSLPRERPMVAAVYLNRMAIGMKLDADPTVAYGLGLVGRRLTYADLRRPSPYNTYLNRGLPPGPICSPGLGSIKAVLHPDRSCRALFFVARGDGSHEFSETFSAHRAAIRESRAARSDGS